MSDYEWTGGNDRLSRKELDALYAARDALGRGLWVSKWTEGRGNAYNALNAYIENLEKFLLAPESVGNEAEPAGGKA